MKINFTKDELSVLCDILFLSTPCESVCVWDTSPIKDCSNCKFSKVKQTLEDKITKAFKEANK